MKLLLVVTVLGVGGPHSATPSMLSNAHVVVTRGAPAHTVATSSSGRLQARLRPGLYSVVALLEDEPLGPPRFCEATAVSVQLRQTGTRRLKLRCSIK